MPIFDCILQLLISCISESYVQRQTVQNNLTTASKKIGKPVVERNIGRVSEHDKRMLQSASLLSDENYKSNKVLLFSLYQLPCNGINYHK